MILNITLTPNKNKLKQIFSVYNKNLFNTIKKSVSNNLKKSREDARNKAPFEKDKKQFILDRITLENNKVVNIMLYVKLKDVVYARVKELGGVGNRIRAKGTKMPVPKYPFGGKGTRIKEILPSEEFRRRYVLKESVKAEPSPYLRPAIENNKDNMLKSIDNGLVNTFHQFFAK